jgi:hypothetical protein
LGEPFEGLPVVGSDGSFALVDVEAVVVPAEELVGLARGNPLQFEETMEHAVTEELGEWLATGAPDEVELVRLIEDTSSGEAMDVRVVGEVVAEGVDSEDDTGAPIGQSSLFAEPVLQGVGDEVAEFGEAFGIFTEDVTQDSGDGQDPVPVRDRKADLIANEGGGIEGTALVAAGAAASSLTGEGEQVVVVAVGALHAEEAAGEVAAAQAVAQGGFAGRVEWPEVFGAVRVVACGEGFERILQALPERRAASMAGPVLAGHALQ